MDKKEYYLYVKGKAVPVSEEVYKAYWKITEHEKYLIKKDWKHNVITFSALDYDGHFVDNIIDERIDLEKIVEVKIQIEELHKALATLTKEERAIKDVEKQIDDRVQLIDQAEKYLKHKDTYKAYTKLKKSKQDNFYNEHTAEIILFESAKKYLKKHLGDNKTLAISKWKSEVANMKKEKNSLYNQILDIREEVEQLEKVKNCIEQLQKQEKRLSQVKRNELDL